MLFVQLYVQQYCILKVGRLVRELSDGSFVGRGARARAHGLGARAHRYFALIGRRCTTLSDSVCLFGVDGFARAFHVPARFARVQERAAHGHRVVVAGEEQSVRVRDRPLRCGVHKENERSREQPNATEQIERI